MRVAASRMDVLESVSATRTSVRAFTPTVSMHAAAIRTLLMVGGGMVAAGVAARMLHRKSRNLALGAAAVGAAGARRSNPWLALLLQLSSAVLIPLLKEKLSGSGLLPPVQEGETPHPLGVVGSLLRLPKKIDLNPTRAFYRWLGLEK